MKNFHNLIITSLFLAIFLISTITASAAAPPIEKILPEDTLVFAGVKNIADFKTKIEKTPFGQMLKAPEMKPFIDKFKNKYKEDVENQMKSRLDMSLEDILGIFNGQAAIALTSLELPGGPAEMPKIGLWFIADTGDKTELAKKMVKTLAELNAEDGGKVRIDKVRGVEVTTIFFSESAITEMNTPPPPPPKPDDWPDDMPYPPPGWEDRQAGPQIIPEITYAFVDSLMFAGAWPNDLERLIAGAQNSGGASLSLDATYQRLDMATGPGDLAFFANTTRVYNILLDSIKQSDPQAEGYLRLAGILDMQGIGGKILIEREGSKQTGLILVPSPRKGIMKIFSPETGDVMPPAYVPDDVMDCVVARYDLEKIYREIILVVSKINPFIYQMVQGTIMNLQNTVLTPKNLDFEKDFVANLGIQHIFFDKKGSTGSALEQDYWFLMGSRNPSRLMAVLKEIMGGGLGYIQMSFEQRDYLGTPIYKAKLQQAMPDPGSPQTGAEATSFAVTDQHLVFANTENALEGYIRTKSGADKPLRDNGEFRKALTFLPERKGVLVYSSDKTGIEELKGLQEEMTMLMDPAEKSQLEEWLDFSLLPDAEFFKKYFNISVGSIMADDTGIWSHGYELFPPQFR